MKLMVSISIMDERLCMTVSSSWPTLVLGLGFSDTVALVYFSPTKNFSLRFFRQTTLPGLFSHTWKRFQIFSNICGVIWIKCCHEQRRVDFCQIFYKTQLTNIFITCNIFLYCTTVYMHGRVFANFLIKGRVSFIYKILPMYSAPSTVIPCCILHKELRLSAVKISRSSAVRQ